MFKKYTWLLFGCMAFARSAWSNTSDDMLKDPEVQKTLRAMNDASTWYHPDLFGEFAAVQRYAHHDLKGAMKYFEIGAQYADKFSQMSIGLMYFNGEGVSKDPIAAYAWLDIAAERDYPDFVATRDRVKATLTPDQLQRGQAMRDKLALRYADAVAKPRMEQQLRFGREQITGSHLGYDSGIYHQAMPGKVCKGTGSLINGIMMPEAGCGGDEVYADARWNPEKYFANRDAQWKATVTVGDINTSGAPADASQSPPATPDKAAPAQHH